ncbi:hypothetical protein SK128_005576 [Halocaridina rubra]|uniref:Mitochondrial thiamine pyrophosphate carrier n=1 Tax=Halocaridina rubra TaxID=373956 RepID=A0AAN9AAH7_HALRR
MSESSEYGREKGGKNTIRRPLRSEFKKKFARTGMDSHVGYKAGREVQLTPIEHAIAGAASGVVTRTFVQPLDVLKIRFQLQVEPTWRRGGGLYHGVLQSTLKIIQNEGLFGLWKGHVPAQLLSISYGIGQFWSYEIFTRAVSEYTDGKRKLTAVCGGLAGVCGTLVSLPCDVIRTRLVAQGTPKIYNGVINAFSKIVKQESVFSLWKGLLPTLAMSAPQTALVFYFYTSFLNISKYLFVNSEENNIAPWLSYSAVSGTAAGVCAKVCIYPLDVLKKRFQIIGFEEARRQFGKVVIYPSAWSCIVSITREEGLRAWFKGLWPSMLKGGASSGIIFVTYEATCTAFARRHLNQENDVS